MITFSYRRALLVMLLVLAIGVSSSAATVATSNGDGAKRVGATATNKDPLSGTPWSHLFIAANFFNNEDVVKQFTESLATLVEEYVLKHMNPLHIYISVFANGSTDDTPKVIEDVLVPKLRVLGSGMISFHVVSNGTTCGFDSYDLQEAKKANKRWADIKVDGKNSGMRSLQELVEESQDGEPKYEEEPGKHADHYGHTTFEGGSFGKKPKAMDRIKWMACVRNAALRPLLEKGTHVFRPLTSDVTHPHQQVLDSEGILTDFSDRSHFKNDEANDAPTPKVDASFYRPPVSADNVAVIFFNDIFFNPKDIVSLLRTKKGNFDMTCGLDQYYSFYDTWVTRDADGRRFFAYPPYGSTPKSQEIFKRFSSSTSNDEMPLSVKDEHAAVGVRCCWNGVSVMRGGLFVNERIRFRYPRVSNKTRVKYAAKEDLQGGQKQGGAPSSVSQQQFDDNGDTDDCYSSECTLLCEDIGRARRMRYDRSVADFLQRRMKKHPEENKRDVAKAAILHAQQEDIDGPPRIYINPMVSVAYEVPFFELHHKNTLITSGVAFTIISWLNIFSWPAWYSPLAPEDQLRIDGGFLDCVKPEDVVTYTVDDLLMVGVVFALGWWFLKRQGLVDRRRRLLLCCGIPGNRFGLKQK